MLIKINKNGWHLKNEILKNVDISIYIFFCHFLSYSV